MRNTTNFLKSEHGELMPSSVQSNNNKLTNYSDNNIMHHLLRMA